MDLSQEGEGRQMCLMVKRSHGPVTRRGGATDVFDGETFSWTCHKKGRGDRCV